MWLPANKLHELRVCKAHVLGSFIWEWNVSVAAGLLLNSLMNSIIAQPPQSLAWNAVWKLCTESTVLQTPVESPIEIRKDRVPKREAHRSWIAKAGTYLTPDPKEGRTALQRPHHMAHYGYGPRLILIICAELEGAGYLQPAQEFSF